MLRGYLAGGGLLVAVYLLLPAGLPRAPVYVGLGLASSAAICAGTVRHRPLRAAPWWCMAVGMLAWSCSDAIYIWYQVVLDTDPFPSIADVGYLVAYPLHGVGFMLLIRGRRAGRDYAGLIDSTIFTVALALLCWVLLMRSIVTDSTTSGLDRAVAAAYPLGDVLITGMLLRLMTTPGARTASFRLLATAAGLLLAADVSFQLVSLHTDYGEGPIDLLFLGSYLLWGAAALHPSMRTLSAPLPEREESLTTTRLAALTVASLVAPCTLAVQLLTGSALDAWPVVASSIVLFLLVVLRMAGLLHRVQEQAGQLADLARTDALTGLPNRRTADAELERLCRRGDRNGRELVVALIDLDRFKSFNDTFGHQAGDRLLCEAAAVWRARLPEGDGSVARYGGEEFLVILERPLLEATAILDAMRAAMPAGQTFSAGVAEWDGQETSTSLVGRADVALYAAKRGGRDRVVPAPRRPAEPGASPAVSPRPAGGTPAR